MKQTNETHLHLSNFCRLVADFSKDTLYETDFVKTISDVSGKISLTKAILAEM